MHVCMAAQFIGQLRTANIFIKSARSALPPTPPPSSLQAMDALSVITDSDIVIKSAHPMSLNFEARVGVGEAAHHGGTLGGLVGGLEGGTWLGKGGRHR